MSALRSRLGDLQRESGLSRDVDVAPTRADTIAGLRLRLQRGSTGKPPRTRVRNAISEHTLATRLGGQLAGEGLIRIRERLERDTLHGHGPLFDPGLHQALDHCSGGEAGASRACVFMDTETTGLAGGTGTHVFLLGMARFSGDTLDLCQLFLSGLGGESAMLIAAQEFLRDTDTLVTFNGRSFDSPLLAARYRLAGLDDPFARLRHVDLLHPTRRTFKNCWPDCRLQTAERRLLGVARVGDLPGSEAPRAWFDWIRHGRDDALSAVCSHNRLDLLSLAVLPGALQRSHADPQTAGANILASAREHCRRPGGGAAAADEERSIFAFLRRYRPHLDAEGQLELARLARRRGEWSLAVDLWQQLAADGLPTAIEHLAKYYEHEQRDYARALGMTSRLLARTPHDRQYRRRDTRLRARLAAMER